MKVRHREIPYGVSADHGWELDGFDYMLYRRDWDGDERVYFNHEEWEKIIDEVASGELPVSGAHFYLYCRTPDLLRIAADIGCYALVHQRFEVEEVVSA